MRKENGQTFWEDGAEVFADKSLKIIGAHPDEIDELNARTIIIETEQLLTRSDLVVVNKESRLGKFVENFTPAKLPKFLLAPTASVVGFITFAACTPSENTPSDEPFPSIEKLQGGRYIDLPISPGPDFRIQQGWTSDFDPEHHGIDIILGELDNSDTWRSFPVLAGADGLVCKNPKQRQGNAVLIGHEFEGFKFYEYSGHLMEIEPWIPSCDLGTPALVKKGQKVGDAGATGADDPSWIHLHWELHDANDDQIDAFDLRDDRELYPNINVPRYTNGKLCGPQTILMDCPTEKDEIPSFSITKTPRKIADPWPDPGIKPTPERFTPEVTPKPTIKPTPITDSPTIKPTPEIVDAGWQTYISPNYGYSWEMPNDWEENNSIGLGDSITYEHFRSYDIAKLHAQVYAQEADPSFNLDEYIDQVFQETYEEGVIVDPNNPPSIDPDPSGVSELAKMRIDEVPITLLYFHSDPYHSSYIDNQVIFVRNGKVWNIKFSYDGESTAEDAQFAHKIFERILNSIDFND